MSEIKYRIIESHEVPELTKIEKSNITAEITLADTLRAHEYNKKTIQSIEAEVGIKKALVANVENNYPEVKEIDEKMQIACHTYYEANKYIKIAEEKLTEFKEAQKELELEINEIQEQTGISKMTEEQKNEIMAGLKKIVKENPEDFKIAEMPSEPQAVPQE